MKEYLVKELLDAYVKNWDGIADESVKAMKSLVVANETIQRVRELHKPFSKSEVICDCCACIYPCPTIKALDGE